jgi:CBS domain containing-hemolysin-like protein
MIDLFPTLILVGFFLLSEAFFSGSEYVLISFSRIRLRHLADNGMEAARILEGLLKTPDKIFGATSVGTNISVVASSAIVTAYLTRIGFVDQADLYSFLLMGPVTLVLGEIVPKILFREKAEALAPWLARPLARSQKLFTPILAVTSLFARGILYFFVPKNGVPTAMVTREELLAMTKMGKVEMNLAQDERRMIHRIFEFRTSTVDEAMQPLISLAAVSVTSSLEQAKERIAESGFSRLPVFRDRIYHIVGVVSAFDILKIDDVTGSLEKVMTTPLYVPESRRNASLLREMTEKNVHMAVVVNEYGAAVGVVTIEDLVEEIVGEIEDEYDAPVKMYEKRGPGRWVVDAMMEVDRINEELGLSLPIGDYETLSGLVNESLERVPKKRIRFALGAYLLTVLDTTPTRAASIEIVDVTADGEGERS